MNSYNHSNSINIKDERLTKMKSDKTLIEKFTSPFKSDMYDGLLYDGDYSPEKKFPVDLSNGENPLGCSPLVKQRIEESLNRIDKYPECQYRGLVSALSEFHKKPESNFVVTSGANGALLATIAAFIGKGDSIVMPALSFQTPAMEVNVRGGYIIAAPLREDMRVDLEALRKNIQPNTKLIYFCNPNNPTGLKLPASDIRNFARSVNIPVLVSEANVEYSGESIMDSDDIPNNLISARSFSKAYGLAGLRIGYAICSTENAVKLLKHLSPYMVSTVSQVAAEAALEDVNHLKISVKYMNGERKYVSEKMAALGFEVLSSDANNVLAIISDQIPNSTVFANELADRGCSIVDGARFLGLSHRAVRIVPRTRDINDNFLSICSEIIDKYSSHKTTIASKPKNK